MGRTLAQRDRRLDRTELLDRSLNACFAASLGKYYVMAVGIDDRRYRYRQYRSDDDQTE